ncbi:hypothetical protein V1281_005431 [Nitrobacteraceae bacterium AZCC 2161]
MADVEQRLPLVAQGPQQRLQLVDFGPAQGRGRLVEDKDSSVDRNTFGDLNELLLADRQCPAGPLDIEIDADLAKHVASAGHHLPAAEPSVLAWLAAKKHVLGNPQVWQ